MIIKVKPLVFCENFMSTETFTKCKIISLLFLKKMFTIYGQGGHLGSFRDIQLMKLVVIAGGSKGKVLHNGSN